MAVAIAENSTETGLSRLPGRPFPKGVSGNPGGRPKGLVRRIREETRDGEELVDYMLGVFRDETAPQKDRIDAATWLADRGFGKPTQPLRQDVEIPDESPFAALSGPQKRAELGRLQGRLEELKELEPVADGARSPGGLGMTTRQESGRLLRDEDVVPAV